MDGPRIGQRGIPITASLEVECVGALSWVRHAGLCFWIDGPCATRGGGGVGRVGREDGFSIP